MSLIGFRDCGIHIEYVQSTKVFVLQGDLTLYSIFLKIMVSRYPVILIVGCFSLNILICKKIFNVLRTLVLKMYRAFHMVKES